jgi:hypothetical protein
MASIHHPRDQNAEASRFFHRLHYISFRAPFAQREKQSYENQRQPMKPLLMRRARTYHNILP